jgi:hypothetical protein
MANFASFFCDIRRLGRNHERPPSLLMAAVESDIVASSMTARQGRGGGATESLNLVPLGTDTSQEPLLITPEHAWRPPDDSSEWRNRALCDRRHILADRASPS